LRPPIKASLTIGFHQSFIHSSVVVAATSHEWLGHNGDDIIASSVVDELKILCDRIPRASICFLHGNQRRRAVVRKFIHHRLRLFR
jgi:hypothetical protein